MLKVHEGLAELARAVAEEHEEYKRAKSDLEYARAELAEVDVAKAAYFVMSLVEAVRPALGAICNKVSELQGQPAVDILRDRKNGMAWFLGGDGKIWEVAQMANHEIKINERTPLAFVKNLPPGRLYDAVAFFQETLTQQLAGKKAERLEEIQAEAEGFRALKKTIEEMT